MKARAWFLAIFPGPRARHTQRKNSAYLFDMWNGFKVTKSKHRTSLNNSPKSQTFSSLSLAGWVNPQLIWLLATSAPALFWLGDLPAVRYSMYSNIIVSVSLPLCCHSSGLLLRSTCSAHLLLKTHPHPSYTPSLLMQGKWETAHPPASLGTLAEVEVCRKQD